MNNEFNDEFLEQRREEEFRAYYYSFIPTGNIYIDQILYEVARAGKAFHHTMNWQDDDYDGKTPIYKIQEAAQEAAQHIEKIEEVAKKNG